MGVWKINVKGNSIPYPVQDYSLVYNFEHDYDGDDIPNTEDNCPFDYNPGQEDSDGDGIGDVCECNAANIDGVNGVNLEDFAKLSANWLLAGPDLLGDSNRDESVDLRDLLQLLQHWLSDCN